LQINVAFLNRQSVIAATSTGARATSCNISEQVCCLLLALSRLKHAKSVGAVN
jgi:hypothetical protein